MSEDANGWRPKSGDVVRWHYATEASSSHCKSHIAVADDEGRLLDTYWLYDLQSLRGSDPFVLPDDFTKSYVVTFLGNLDDYDKAREYQACYFDDTDILNLNHANSSSGNFFVRKGAKRSEAKIRSEIAARMAAEKQAIQSAQWGIERYEAELRKLEAGDLQSVCL